MHYDTVIVLIIFCKGVPCPFEGVEVRYECVRPKLNCALAAVGGYKLIVSGVEVVYVINLFTPQ